MAENKLISKTFKEVNPILVNDGDFRVELARLDHDNARIATIINNLKLRLRQQDTSVERKIIMVTIHLYQITAYYDHPISITTPTITNEDLKKKMPNINVNDRNVIIVLRTLCDGFWKKNVVTLSATRNLNVPDINNYGPYVTMNYDDIVNKGDRIYIKGESLTFTRVPLLLSRLLKPVASNGDKVQVIA